jgi:hypothetical protein
MERNKVVVDTMFRPASVFLEWIGVPEVVDIPIDVVTGTWYWKGIWLNTGYDFAEPGTCC